MSVIAWNDDVSTCKNINKKKTMNPPFAHSKAIGAYD
jgi:hypothetical protein